MLRDVCLTSPQRRWAAEERHGGCPESGSAHARARKVGLNTEACRGGRQGTRVLSAAALELRCWVPVSSSPRSLTSSGVLCDTSPEPGDALWLGAERTRRGGDTAQARARHAFRDPRSSRGVQSPAGRRRGEGSADGATRGESRHHAVLARGSPRAVCLAQNSDLSIAGLEAQSLLLAAHMWETTSPGR